MDLEKPVERREDSTPADLGAAAAPVDAAELTKREKNRRIELLEQVHDQFRASGAKYLFKDQPGKIAFKDKGEWMVSASNDDRVAEAMTMMAEAKGWTTLKVSGHLDFQREVWMEASLRGLEVRGFKPSEQDLKTLEARRARAMHNTATKDAGTREQNGGEHRQTGRAAPKRQASEQAPVERSV